MIVITTSSSSSVKPRWRFFFISPILVVRPVDRLAAREREHVVDVLATPRDRVGLVLVGAQAPLHLARHGIDWDAPEELELLVDLPDLRHALDERLEVLRVTLAAELNLDRTGVGVRLVFVDGVAHEAELLAELDFLLPLDRVARDGDDHRGQYRDHGGHERELHDGEAALPPRPTPHVIAPRRPPRRPRRLPPPTGSRGPPRRRRSRAPR